GPRALTRILDQVVKLPKAKVELFGKLLERTSLSSIIDFLNEVTDRIATIHAIQAMVIDKELREGTREKEHLHRLVGANAWLFGEELAIALNEIGLTKDVAELRGSNPQSGSVVRRDGRKGRLDVLIPRVAKSALGDGDLHLVVELKRPSHSLSMK